MKRAGSNDLPTNLEGSLLATYAGQGTALVERLREELRKFPELIGVTAPRALTETVLRAACGERVSTAVIRELSRRFEADTCDAFLAADAKALKLGTGSCHGYPSRMDVIRLDTTIDEALARALPALRPALGRHVELVAAEKPDRRPTPSKLTVDQLFASRIEAVK